MEIEITHKGVKYMMSLEDVKYDSDQFGDDHLILSILDVTGPMEVDLVLEHFADDYRTQGRNVIRRLFESGHIEEHVSKR